MDRNLLSRLVAGSLITSLSARRAWIEIKRRYLLEYTQTVALRKESVDRNCPKLLIVYLYAVALRKESVDRNLLGWFVFVWFCVALRKESVDRNTRSFPWDLTGGCRSPQGERG